jgi:hypothetical protein
MKGRTPGAIALPHQDVPVFEQGLKSPAMAGVYRLFSPWGGVSYPDWIIGQSFRDFSRRLTGDFHKSHSDVHTETP